MLKNILAIILSIFGYTTPTPPIPPTPTVVQNPDLQTRKQAYQEIHWSKDCEDKFDDPKSDWGPAQTILPVYYEISPKKFILQIECSTGRWGPSYAYNFVDKTVQPNFSKILTFASYEWDEKSKKYILGSPRNVVYSEGEFHSQNNQFDISWRIRADCHDWEIYKFDNHKIEAILTNQGYEQCDDNTKHPEVTVFDGKKVYNIKPY